MCHKYHIRSIYDNIFCRKIELFQNKNKVNYYYLIIIFQKKCSKDIHWYWKKSNDHLPKTPSLLRSNENETNTIVRLISRDKKVAFTKKQRKNPPRLFQTTYSVQLNRRKKRILKTCFLFLRFSPQEKLCFFPLHIFIWLLHIILMLCYKTKKQKNVLHHPNRCTYYVRSSRCSMLCHHLLVMQPQHYFKVFSSI